MAKVGFPLSAAQYSLFSEFLEALKQVTDFFVTSRPLGEP